MHGARQLEHEVDEGEVVDHHHLLAALLLHLGEVDEAEGVEESEGGAAEGVEGGGGEGGEGHGDGVGLLAVLGQAVARAGHQVEQLGGGYYTKIVRCTKA